MHMQAPVCVGGRKVWAFCEDGAPQAPEQDFALPHLYLSISFPSVSPPFSPLSILFSFIHSLQRVATSADLYWQYMVEHGNSRSIRLAQGPIHQFTNLSVLVWERKAANLSSLLSIDHTLRLHFSV